MSGPSLAFKACMKSWLKLILVFLVVKASLNTAQAFVPTRSANSLWEPKEEMVQKISSARVVLAEYTLIRKDFPEIKDFSNTQIDEWLIRNTAFVSEQQATQTVVNDPITTTSEKRMAYRPREYRRAHVFVVDTGGLIDAKGTGAVDPSGGSHDNGLATLGDMIREYGYEKLIHAIFERDGRFDTVGSYAVIDYGFNIKHPDGGRSRAGTVLRQAHARYRGGNLGTNRSRGQSTMLPRDLQLEIDKLLRRHGVSSTVMVSGLDGLNLQGAENGAVIDFGSFLTRKTFTRPVVYFYDSKGNATFNERDVIAKPGDPHYLQPDLKLQIPFNLWGYSQSGKEDSKYDNPYIWAHELAENLATGRASRADVEQHIRNLFDNTEVQEMLRNTPRSCRSFF